jgi:hypothetical protein
MYIYMDKKVHTMHIIIKCTSRLVSGWEKHLEYWPGFYVTLTYEYLCEECTDSLQIERDTTT